jgi:hypothetical protein
MQVASYWLTGNDNNLLNYQPLKFFDVSGFFWSACIAFHAYRTIKSKAVLEPLSRYLIAYSVISYGCGVVFAVLPFAFSDAYGPTETVW